MREKLIELLEEGQHEFLEMQTQDNDPQDWDMRTSSEVIADHLIANIRELDAEQEAGLTIRNLQLESEVKQLRSKLAESAPRWIPISERLPEAYESVIVATGDRDTVTGFVDHEGRFFYDDPTFAIIYATHWMPLPMPPQEDE